VVSPGQLFGLGALVGVEGSATHAEAMEESCICEAGAHDFLAMLARHPLLMARVIMVMAKQIFRLEQTIESMASQHVSQRLAALLLEEMAEGQTLDGGVLLPVRSHEELAKLIGTTRESVSRTNVANGACDHDEGPPNRRNDARESSPRSRPGTFLLGRIRAARPVVKSVRQRRHDLVVIGGGSAGLVAAEFGARFGADVLLIEKDKLGGDCTWTGCVPSKALLHAAGVAHQIRAASDVGSGTKIAEVNFPEVMRRVREAVAAVYSFETPEQLRRRGIEVELAEAQFLDRTSVEVAGRRIVARNLIICAGAVPQRPPVTGLEVVPHRTYEEVFDLEELPHRLLVLGGGPIGVELAQAFAHLGSEVTLAEKESRLLPMADREASDLLTRRLAADGVRIETGLELEKVLWDDGKVMADSARGRMTADLLLVATGRRPDVEGLQLARAGVDHDQHGIRVDQKLKTSQDHIYAAGDVIGSFQFMHYAGWQGCVAARNALFPGSIRGVGSTVPWAVFTQPELAQVGLTEEQAREQGRKMAVHRLPLERVDRAQTSRQTDGFIKIVATPSGKILGATIVAPAAGELANELSVAIACGVDLQRLASTMHVYPSKGSATEHSSLSVCRPHGTSLRSPRSCRPLTHRLAIESGRWGDTRSPVSPGSKPSSVRIARSGAPADHACGREAVGYWTGGLRGSRGKPANTSGNR